MRTIALHHLTGAKKLDTHTIAKFQTELNAMGYKFQFVSLAGFHSLNYSMFDLAQGYSKTGMTAYSALQNRDFASEVEGTRRQNINVKLEQATSIW